MYRARESENKEYEEVHTGSKTKLILLLISRTLLFAIFQLLIALALRSWHESEKYWMLVATLGNLVSILFLFLLFKSEGKKYLGDTASRTDNLTDAVFGIAITLLIFNLLNPNSFDDLITFTKTLPAFLISISFLVLFRSEHLRFSEIYTLNNTTLIILNTLFIALSIETSQIAQLMIYYGFTAFALYFILFLFYHKASRMKEEFELNTQFQHPIKMAT